MEDSQLFKQMDFIRMRTIAALDNTTEEMADLVPDGFKNSIRWNLGHIYLSQENLIHSFAGEKGQIPEGFPELFGFNTSPDSWEATPPSLPELRQLLSEQPKRLKDSFLGRLSEKGEKPFQMTKEIAFETLAEVVSFANWHEGLHQGAITSIKRVQGIENLWDSVKA
ncbi:DinB family protein [Rossellomorea vietnamensis]|uniref:DinB family protein n=1 Tax=Rossellomorea vietnamensis TaxID=218284 RepID=A0A5D4MAH1_9BACI|nr:DinB family protein [Rossellomorea vietnamensis]TYR98692.1 DinB family protein [Rossellomorea vietnamensis]